MNDSDISSAYERAIEREHDRSCPSPETILSLVEDRGKMDATERVHVLNHIMSCSSCKREFDLLDCVHVAARPETRIRLRRPAWITAAAAAAVLVVAVIWQPWNSGPAGVTRGAEGAFELLPLEVHAGVPTLRWTSVPGAVEYEVRITTADGRLVRSLTVTDTLVTLTAALETRRGLRWRVTTRQEDGSRKRSPVRELR